MLKKVNMCVKNMGVKYYKCESNKVIKSHSIVYKKSHSISNSIVFVKTFFCEKGMVQFKEKCQKNNFNIKINHIHIKHVKSFISFKPVLFDS